MSKTLRQLIEESASLPREAVRESEVVEQLRKVSRPDALSVLKELANRRSPCAIAIATRAINDRASALDFFSFSFQIADAHGIKPVLEFGVTKLGLRRVVQFLAENKLTNPQQVQKAVYWLPSMIRPEEVGLLNPL